MVERYEIDQRRQGGDRPSLRRDAEKLLERKRDGRCHAEKLRWAAALFDGDGGQDEAAPSNKNRSTNSKSIAPR